MAENLDTTVNSEKDADDSEVVHTLGDLLDMEDEMIEDVAAVLGASNEKICSYGEGYLKRQALYSCLTCIPESKQDPEKGAGVCLACSYHCHMGHELVELYTKRNFRCDCGNSKFNGVKCNFPGTKDEVNAQNVYNQNFSGIYCTCHRPYPDAEDPVPDEMIQCIICEDWYHSRHLGVDMPTGTFAEMTCASCMGKHEFLLHYSEDTGTESQNVSVVDEGASEEPQEPPKTCKKPATKSETIATKFWPDLIWRKQLCTCDDCVDLYTKEDVLFLIDAEDPVHLYEEKGKAKVKEASKEADENLTNQLNSLDRVQLVEVISGYNDLKENLAEYLKKFAESKKVVREEDIREFFDGMMARKKRKLNNSVPHFCR